MNTYIKVSIFRKIKLFIMNLLDNKEYNSKKINCK